MAGFYIKQEKLQKISDTAHNQIHQFARKTVHLINTVITVENQNRERWLVTKTVNLTDSPNYQREFQ